MTEIKSDDEQFEDLSPYQEIKAPAQKLSVEEKPQPKPPQKSYKVEIKQKETTSQMNLLENKYYSVQVREGNEQKLNEVTRRFSDFDMLFEMLFRKYKGRILPAFPVNGILSYVKSKVTITKDDKFVNERIAMVQRFLTIILNETDFAKCPEVVKFLDEKQFGLLKQEQKQMNQGLIANSWASLTKFIGMVSSSQQNKFKNQITWIQNSKKKFNELYTSVKSFLGLLYEERQLFQFLEKRQLDFYAPCVVPYLQRSSAVQAQMKCKVEELQKLELRLYCEMEDHNVAIKMLESMQEMRKTAEAKLITAAEETFRSQFSVFKKKKQEFEASAKSSFARLLAQIKSTDEKF